MPVEVRELVIKAVVDNQTKKPEAQQKPAEKDNQDIVDDCVEQVLEILKREKER